MNSFLVKLGAVVTAPHTYAAITAVAATIAPDCGHLQPLITDIAKASAVLAALMLQWSVPAKPAVTAVGTAA